MSLLLLLSEKFALTGMYYDALFPMNDDEYNLCPSIGAIFSSAQINLFDLYDNYLLIYGVETTSQVMVPFRANISSTAQCLLIERLKRSRSSTSGSNIMELDKYLTSSFQFSNTYAANFDILKWWIYKAKDFSVISAIAKISLACPVFAVTVEQTFNHLAQILDKKRSRKI